MDDLANMLQRSFCREVICNIEMNGPPRPYLHNNWDIQNLEVCRYSYKKEEQRCISGIQTCNAQDQGQIVPEALSTMDSIRQSGGNVVAIDSVPRLPGCPYVFYNPETRTRWCEVRKPWEKARTKAGYPWLRVRDLRPAFGIAASELGAPMHYIQSALDHGSVAFTERYYAKYDPKSAAKQLLRLIEGGKVKTGTWGE